MASVSGVFPMGDELHLLEIRLQAIQLSPYHAGSPSNSPHTPGHDYWFPGMLFSPAHLSATGKPSDPEIHLQSLPAQQGIQQSASWRTHVLVAAEAGDERSCSPGQWAMQTVVVGVASG